MKTGTIVLTRFPFTDLTSTKRRPAVIISKYDRKNPDVVVAFISSNISSTVEKTDFLLKTTHSDFAQTGLKMDSIIKFA